MNDKSSRIVWQQENSWRLREVTLALPDGSILRRGVIEHPGSVVLVPLQKGEGQWRVLMLRQYRLAVAETVLELPAGTRGWEEDWLACAQRELREETGFRAEQFTPLGEVWPAPGLSNELMRIYLAQGLSRDPLPADVDEEIVVRPTPLAELVEMARDGRLRDGKSVVGILRAAVYLNR